MSEQIKEDGINSKAGLNDEDEKEQTTQAVKNDEKSNSSPSSAGAVKKTSIEKFMEKITLRRLQCLNLSDNTNRPRKLETLDIEGVAKYLKTCKNIICMIGAGISTSAGIPDFRSPETGLYSKLQEFELPFPEAVFELDFFKENPKPFFTVAKQIFPANFNPTLGHYFLRLLYEKGHLLRVYSQNIDMLEQLAGIPKNLVVNAHGSFNVGHCIRCRKEHSFEWMKEELFKNEYLKCTNPDCEKGVVKPDIVFFGEVLPMDFFEKAEEDFTKCDLLIIMGTSLKVQPFASLTCLVDQECPRLLINREAVGYDLDYDRGNINYRDVFLQQDCDHGCLKLTKLLNWDNELKKYVDIKKVEIKDEKNKL